MRRLLRQTYTEREVQAILSRRVFIGMSADAVRESLGSPNDINRTVTGRVIYEQWVYERDGIYVYLENGRVDSWQD